MSQEIKNIKFTSVLFAKMYYKVINKTHSTQNILSLSFDGEVEQNYELKEKKGNIKFIDVKGKIMCVFLLIG